MKVRRGFGAPGARALVAFALTATAVMLLQVNPQAAQGFPQTRGNCDNTDDDLRWWFYDWGNWDASEKDAVRDGIDDWLTVQGAAGNGVVSSIVETAPEVGEIKVMKIAGLGALGETDCQGAVRTIKIRANVTDDQFRWIAAHEMGHHLEMWHTGNQDHFDPLDPDIASYMAVCSASFEQLLTQDDAGHVTHKWGAASNPSIHTNIGFEQGLTYWGTKNLSSWSIVSSDPYQGASNLQFRPSSADGYIYQTMNVVHPATFDIDVRSAYRKVSSATTTGRVKLQIWRQSVVYGDSPSACEQGQFQAGPDIDQNERVQEFGFLKVTTQAFNPTTSWKVGTEPDTYTLYASQLGSDIRIMVRSNVKYSDGSFALVEVDSARVRDRS